MKAAKKCTFGKYGFYFGGLLWHCLFNLRTSKCTFILFEDTVILICALWRPCMILQCPVLLYFRKSASHGKKVTKECIMILQAAAQDLHQEVCNWSSKGRTCQTKPELMKQKKTNFLTVKTWFCIILFTRIENAQDSKHSSSIFTSKNLLMREEAKCLYSLLST